MKFSWNFYIFQISLEICRQLGWMLKIEIHHIISQHAIRIKFSFAKFFRRQMEKKEKKSHFQYFSHCFASFSESSRVKVELVPQELPEFAPWNSLNTFPRVSESHKMTKRKWKIAILTFPNFVQGSSVFIMYKFSAHLLAFFPLTHSSLSTTSRT